MKYSYVIVTISFLLTISSCCCKKACSTFLDVQLYNFSAADVNTVIIRRYPQGGGAIIDSIHAFCTPSADSSYYYVQLRQINVDTVDLAIWMPGPNKLYYLNHFNQSKTVCNACIVGSDYYTRLSGCDVNGVAQGNPVNIIKQ